MATCPAGHTSESTDYCDICGVPMERSSAGGAPAAGAPAGGGAVAEGQKTMGVVCPNCGVMNAPGALFCEACGYDYTTGTMPQRPDPFSVLDLDAPLPDQAAAAATSPPAAVDTAGSGGIDLSGWSQPKERTPAAPTQSPSTPAAPALDIDAPTPTPAFPASAAPDAAPAPQASPVPPGPPSPQRPSSVAERASDTFDWVVEIWIDPEWYAMQQSPDPMPSPGLPDIMPLRKRSVLIGRPSRSRNIHPDIDCEPDSGISRRQAELSTDGTRWFIEDLNSANGTYVAEAAAGLPKDPIPSGRRRELDGDERIYMGAWTRLVLRRATPEEQQAYASV